MSKLSVLIVHPDAEMSARIARAIRSAGHTVTTVTDGERAIDEFVQNPVDVLIIEQALPGRDGGATIESIRWTEPGKRVPIILLGTGGTPRNRLEAVGKRVHAFETLPGELNLAAIAQALGRVPRDSTSQRLPKQPKELKPDKHREATRFARALDEAGTFRTDGGDDPALGRFEELTPAPGGKSDRPVDQPARRADDWFDETSGTEAEGEAIAVEQHALSVGRDKPLLDGDLEVMPFPRLLHWLAERRATGALVITARGTEIRTTNRATAKKVVFFRSGFPVFVQSNVADETLGRVLLKNQMITEEELRESIRIVREGEARQGSALMAMGALSPHELRDALERQLRVKLFDLFGWSAGAFRFSDRTPMPNETVALEMSLTDMVFQGVSKRTPYARVMQMLAPHMARYAVPDRERAKRFLRLDLAAEARRALFSLDGTQRLRTLLGENAERGGTVAPLVYAMDCVEAIGFRDAPYPVEKLQVSDASNEPVSAPASEPPAGEPRPGGEAQQTPLRPGGEAQQGEPARIAGPMSAVTRPMPPLDPRHIQLRQLHQLLKAGAYADALEIEIGALKGRALIERANAESERLAELYRPLTMPGAAPPEIRAMAFEVCGMLLTAPGAIAEDVKPPPPADLDRWDRAREEARRELGSKNDIKLPIAPTAPTRAELPREQSRIGKPEVASAEVTHPRAVAPSPPVESEEEIDAEIERVLGVKSSPRKPSPRLVDDDEREVTLLRAPPVRPPEPRKEEPPRVKEGPPAIPFRGEAAARARFEALLRQSDRPVEDGNDDETVEGQPPPAPPAKPPSVREKPMPETTPDVTVASRPSRKIDSSQQRDSQREPSDPRRLTVEEERSSSPDVTVPRRKAPSGRRPAVSESSDAPSSAREPEPKKQSGPPTKAAPEEQPRDKTVLEPQKKFIVSSRSRREFIPPPVNEDGVTLPRAKRAEIEERGAQKRAQSAKESPIEREAAVREKRPTRDERPPPIEPSPAARDLKRDDPGSGESIALSAPSLPEGLDERVAHMYQAERYFRRGERAARRERWDEAVSSLEQAVALCPEEGEFLAHLGHARYRQAPSDPSSVRKALDELDRGCKLSPSLDAAFVLHARVQRAQGNEDGARAMFKRALAINPENREAREALGR